MFLAQLLIDNILYMLNDLILQIAAQFRGLPDVLYLVLLLHAQHLLHQCTHVADFGVLAQGGFKVEG
jgi:hypothetical protein